MTRGRKKNCVEMGMRMGDKTCGNEVGWGTRSAGTGWGWGQCCGNGVGMGMNSCHRAALYCRNESEFLIEHVFNLKFSQSIEFLNFPSLPFFS